MPNSHEKEQIYRDSIVGKLTGEAANKQSVTMCLADLVNIIES